MTHFNLSIVVVVCSLISLVGCFFSFDIECQISSLVILLFFQASVCMFCCVFLAFV